MTTPHVSDQLSMLVTGELDRTDTHQVAGHLRACGPCRNELVDVIAANAALRSASRVRQADRREDEAQVEQSGEPLPSIELSPDADQSEGGRLRSDPRRWYRRLGVAAACAAVLVGAGLITADTVHKPAPIVATVALHPLDNTAVTLGDVTVIAADDLRQMTVTGSGLGTPPKNQFYEVWLLNPATNKMLPVGVLSSTGTNHYVITAALMSDYSAVDVSLQTNDGDPRHSNVSVLRGYY
jgi:anti-sigma-K factor RskA